MREPAAAWLLQTWLISHSTHRSGIQIGLQAFQFSLKEDRLPLRWSVILAGTSLYSLCFPCSVVGKQLVQSSEEAIFMTNSKPYQILPKENSCIFPAPEFHADLIHSIINFTWKIWHMMVCEHHQCHYSQIQFWAGMVLVLRTVTFTELPFANSDCCLFPLSVITAVELVISFCFVF